MDSLGNHLQPVHEILKHGYDTYQNYPPELVLDHDPTTQANCIAAHMRAKATSSLADDPTITHIEEHGQHLWLFEQQNVLIRFKKTDETGISTNYPTKHARDFEAGADLPGIPPSATRLTAGYLLNPLGEYSRSQISMPNGSKRVLWCAAIVPCEDAQSMTWCQVEKNMTININY